MSNTTPESPEDRPAQEPAAGPATDTGAHVASPSSATDSSATDRSAAGRSVADDDLDDEPGVAGAAPVASSAHISGASDTGQTRAYEPVTNQTEQPEQTERPADRPVTAEQTTAPA
jgi:hypothetical protein